jgi:hypothetical protein
MQGRRMNEKGRGAQLTVKLSSMAIFHASPKRACKSVVLSSGVMFRISIFVRSSVSVGDLGFMQWEMMRGIDNDVGRQCGAAMECRCLLTRRSVRFIYMRCAVQSASGGFFFFFFATLQLSGITKAAGTP